MMQSSSRKRKRARFIIPAYPAFNIYSNTADKTTALGPVCVATAVSRLPGWDAEVIDENNLRLYGVRADPGGADHEFLQEQRPTDVVGLYGGLTSTIPRLYELARFYKSKAVLTIAGGQHFTDETVEEALRSGIDYVVLGEGESAVVEILRGLEAGSGPQGIPGLVYLKDGKMVHNPRREPRADFDELPLPDYGLVRYARIKMYPVERIRGCGMDCEFCTVKGRPRCASPERLLEQISILLETKDARHFFIVDDLFGQDRAETLRFCQMLADYQKAVGKRLDLTVQIRLDKAKDHELLSAMRRAGINTVAIGFETPIAEELEAMRKHVRPEEMIFMARQFHKAGFFVHGMFIFGYPLGPGEPFRMSVDERIRRYRDFFGKARLDTVQVLLPVPLPGTELRSRLMEQGRIYPVGEVGWEYYDGSFPLFEPDPPLTPGDMLRAVRVLMGGFYRLRSMLGIVLNVLSFPALIFFVHDIRLGWKKWYRSWRNDLVRSAGWFVVKGWRRNFDQEAFFERLRRAQGALAQRNRQERSHQG